MEVDDESRKIRQVLQQCLRDVEAKMANLGDDVMYLADDQLKSLNIHKAQPLDIDESSVDFGPRFFRPKVPAVDMQKIRQKVERHWAFEPDDPTWREKCTSDPDRVYPMFECACWRILCARLRDEYAGHYVGLWCDVLESRPDWTRVSTTDLACQVRGHLPGFACFGPVALRREGKPDLWYHYDSLTAFLYGGASASKPHIAATVRDSCESEEHQVLRSEVATALSLLRWQFHRRDFRDHHTLPSLVFSFQHDKYCRITQFHFDGSRLVMRPSRRLNLDSDRPNDEIYHVIRWMANDAIGHTEYRTPGDEQTDQEVDHGSDSDPIKLPLKV